MGAEADIVFFGGTALTRTVLPNGWLSEDIDLLARLPPTSSYRHSAFAAAKASALSDRRAARDLWDLWALAA
ncbi:hypothetical protein [Pseudonocardia xishanensis]|uniref:Nucleotidyltransferase AbiEii toxin of type IV toxin-antitoxin system n=1 Tax=Pseudonocardia xishanensis TaxID=630995 RepID=A0ABP8RDM9_9PSEU